MQHRSLIAAPLLAALSLMPACATSDHAAVIDREVRWATAMRDKDMPTLEGLMAPDFRLTHEAIPPFALTIDEGNPAPGLPGWRWRRNLDAMSFGRVELAGVDAVSIDDDLIAVNMTMTLDEWTADGPDGVGDNSGSYDVTDIWVNRDGEWRVFSRYARPYDGGARPRPDFVIDD